jgi:putative exporter of polyketide antibiotics
VVKKLILPPAGRDARNEQWKLRAALVNALSIALVLTGLFGPYINPASLGQVTILDRIVLLGIGGLLHLFATLLVHGIEDKP